MLYAISKKNFFCIFVVLPMRIYRLKYKYMTSYVTKLVFKSTMKTPASNLKIVAPNEETKLKMLNFYIN